MPEFQNGKHPGMVVRAIHTQTSTFVSPDGEQFPYYNIRCIMEPGMADIDLLFNPQLTVGMMDGGVQMLRQIFGMTKDVSDTQMQLDLDGPVDWDKLPPPPDDPTQP